MERIKVLNKYTGVVCAVIVLMLIVFFHHEIIWDEEWYIEQIAYIHISGLRFVINDPAAPMHAVIHYIFSPITHLHSPQIRLLNFSMCFCICIIMYRILKMDKRNTDVSLRYAFSLFLLPGFFLIAFFAITEAPCLLFYTASVFFLMKYVLLEKQNLLHIILAGVFLGFAVLTRQLFLVCIGPACVLVFYTQYKHRWPAVILFVIGALLIFGPVFYMWKGMVPSTSFFKTHHEGKHFSIEHVFLSFGYAFFYFIILMPVYIFQFIKRNWKFIVVIIIIGISIPSFLMGDGVFAPISGLLSHLFSDKIVNVIGFVFFKVIEAVSLVLISFLLFELYINRKDFIQVFFVLSMLSILITPVMILDQFSSRYSMQIAPVLVMFAYSRIKLIDARMQLGINFIAVAINIIAVITFFIYS